jgi:hypothetical protein
MLILILIMEIIKEAIIEARPHLSKQSIATYNSILKNLYIKVFGTEEVDLKKFDDAERILKFLKLVEPNKRKTILSALLVISGVKDYRKQMLEDIKVYNEEQNKQLMSSAQTKSWVDGEEIRTLMNSIEKNAKLIYKKEEPSMSDLQQVQNYIILCLLGGIYIPPRRSKDYVDFKIKNISKTKDNYLQGNKLVFNSYKTAKSYGRQEIIVPPVLLKILKKWIKINPTDYLLFDSNSSKMSNVKLNQRLNKLFGDKKVGVNQLRHTYLSDKYQGTIQTNTDMHDDMKDMGSSSKHQEKVYIKRKKAVKSNVV